ncbi:hypothetical protein MC28_5158 [Bacillus thuringiensis MC28]|nr:hypothetical protein MC28_5158 [Bacillus thuringiensis MC28]
MLGMTQEQLELLKELAEVWLSENKEGTAEELLNFLQSK